MKRSFSLTGGSDDRKRGQMSERTYRVGIIGRGVLYDCLIIER
jgi:hypothetical protein